MPSPIGKQILQTENHLSRSYSLYLGHSRFPFDNYESKITLSKHWMGIFVFSQQEQNQRRLDASSIFSPYARYNSRTNLS